MNQMKQTNLTEEIKALEINSTSNDQRDSQQEKNNLSLENTDSIKKQLNDVKLKRNIKRYEYKKQFSK